MKNKLNGLIRLELELETIDGSTIIFKSEEIKKTEQTDNIIKNLLSKLNESDKDILFLDSINPVTDILALTSKDNVAEDKINAIFGKIEGERPPIVFGILIQEDSAKYLQQDEVKTLIDNTNIRIISSKNGKMIENTEVRREKICKGNSTENLQDFDSTQKELPKNRHFRIINSKYYI
jgi:hypothetical protein